MRALALALVLAAAASALAAPRAAGLAQADAEPQHFHHHGGSMMPWMMRQPFSFDAEFDGDGSCEVHRSGDGRGTLRGSESCEKNVRGHMELEKEDRGDGVVSARSRNALGAALEARLGADGEVPAGMIEAAVVSALSDMAPEELQATLQAGGSLDIKAKAKFSFECNIRKQDEKQDGRGDDYGSFKADVKCTMSKEKNFNARCSRRDEVGGPDMY
jgi:hypothetical protein